MSSTFVVYCHYCEQCDALFIKINTDIDFVNMGDVQRLRWLLIACGTWETWESLGEVKKKMDCRYVLVCTAFVINVFLNMICICETGRRLLNVY